MHIYVEAKKKKKDILGGYRVWTKRQNKLCGKRRSHICFFYCEEGGKGGRFELQAAGLRGGKGKGLARPRMGYDVLFLGAGEGGDNWARKGISAKTLEKAGFQAVNVTLGHPIHGGGDYALKKRKVSLWGRGKLEIGASASCAYWYEQGGGG